MGLRQRLSDLFWPPEFEGEKPAPSPVEAPATLAHVEQRAGLADRLRRVGIREEQGMSTPHNSQPTVDEAMQPEARARREAAYEQARASCPIPIHPEMLPLPGGLRLHDDEFLVAANSRQAGGAQLTLTTQRLMYTRGRNADTQLVVYLADISDVAFHRDGSLTIGTPSGRWERLAVGGNNLAASRDGLLALIHHARALRSPLPGGIDELLELRERGAIGTPEYESRRSAATTAPRRRARRQVEVSGKPTRRNGQADAEGDAALAAPPENPAQPEDGAGGSSTPRDDT